MVNSPALRGAGAAYQPGGTVDRYTKSDANAAFERLATAMGKYTGDAWSNGRAKVGAWYLEGQHRRYRVAEIVSESGAEKSPLGYWFRNARDFCLTVEFTLDALRIAKSEL